MKKTIFITGATAGFGEAIAKKFATGSYRLILAGRRLERLKALKELLEKQEGAEVIILTFDVRDKQQVQQAFNTLSIDAIDILVNNAGLASGMAPIDEGDEEDWDVMIDTNVKGLLYVTKAALPLLKKSKT